MELIVNGQKLDITLENERTVGEVLKAFEEEAARNQATTVGITLNGKDVSAEDFEKAIATPLSDDTKIELSVVSQKEIKEAFQKSADHFTELSQKLSDVSLLLQSGKDKEASAIITELAAEVEAFCHSATLSALFPETYKSVSIEGKDIGSFFEELAPILSDFENALADKDTVTLGDLSEYEIAPRLTSLSDAIKASLA